ncbi:condensation domain-containing protein [Streptomyces sp. NPDC057717]|uniref:condensation domain-containing protein n=1 Tax=Streptomyces sp. NPDC057717 TaxID=3346224 RepID=UPI0036A64FDB
MTEMETYTDVNGEATSTAVLVRPLGAFERMYHRYMERNPIHFSVVAEFDSVVSETDIRKALAALQERHQLLSVHVREDTNFGPGFYRFVPVPEIELTVADYDPREWESWGARELSIPFDRSVAPLMRAVLLRDASVATILLSFDHTIADGISATYVLNDLVASLNGEPLPVLPVPLSQEDLIARTLPAVEELSLPEPLPTDPRLGPVGALRPFDATEPDVRTMTLDAAVTTQLRERCRTEKTTVHAAIVAAASRARSTLRDEEFVRVVTPFNFRRHIGAHDECADYFTCTRTGMAPHGGDDLWDQARTIGTELAEARSVPGVVATSAAVQEFIPADADADTAEDFMSAQLSYEVMISNLGLLDIARTGPIQPSAVWGPVLMCQADGEDVIGIVTYNDRLRMVACGHTPTGTLLEKVRTTLIEACESTTRD